MQQAGVAATRGLPRYLTWVRAAVIASFVVLVAAWVARPWVGGDTPFVLDGTNAFLDCLSAGDLVGCRHSGKLDYWGLTSPIGDWPLLQHVPDAISIGLGGTSHAVRTRVLALLSVAGLAGSLLLARIVLTRIGQTAWFWGFAFVALSGPTLAYARTTAGEMLASGLLVALVAATLLQAPPAVVGLAALGACWTKETAYPFIATLGLLALVLARRRTGRPIRPHVVWGATGMAVAIVTASLFNVVRFGSVLNTNYLEPELHTPGIGRKVEYALAVVVSPNGGIVPFWPAAAAVVVAACSLPFVFRSRRELDPRPALVLVAVVVGLGIGFASWWTPFGWSAYGPRLMLPWVLPLVLLALAAYGDALGDLARALLSRSWRLLAVFAVGVVFALPHVGQMWRPGEMGGFFAQEHPPCDAPWRGGVAKWHACQHRLMWQDRPLMLYAARGAGAPSGVATSIVVSAALLGCLLLLREGLAARRPTAERTEPRRPAETLAGRG